MIYILTKERLAFNQFEDQIQYIESYDFIKSWLKSENPKTIAVDTETTGLDFIENHTVMFQIGTLKDQFIVDTRYYNLSPFKEILESKEVLKILHNVKFDYKFILKEAGISLEYVFDTYLTEKVITCGKNLSCSLSACAERYLDIFLEKDTRNTFSTHQGPFTSKQLLYGAKDITIPLKIYQKQLEVLQKENLSNIADLENKAVLAFADIEYNGIEVDEEKWLKNAEKANKELKQIEVELNSILEEDPKYKKFMLECKQLDFFKSDNEISFIDQNWNSPKQVLKVFKEDYPELESVGKPELLTLDHKTDLVKKYIEFKKLSKLYNSYGPTFLEHINSDGKIHTNFSQILATGRVSSSDPNMQQIPTLDAYRNCFIVSDPDWVFVSSDYSSQELCVIATLSKDPVWLKALKDGKDLHSVCAELVFGSIWKDAAEHTCNYYLKNSNGDPINQKCNCDEHKKLRDSVKAINFGLAYGMSEYALSDRMDITVQEARELIALYFKTFPKIQQTLADFGEFGKRYGYIMTMPPFKRKRYFPGHSFIKTDNSMSGKIERASKNTPIQGSSADITKLAMIYVRNYIKKYNLPVKMVMVVHDQIDTIVHKDYKERWKIELTELMEKAAKKIITNGLLKAETEDSPVWKK